MAEEVHLAMLARGWRGDARTLRPPTLRPTDAVFAVCCLLAAAVTIGADHGLG
jgi:cobalt/nickel transport system permease protein